MNTLCNQIYKSLLARYGNLSWWPARSSYEVMVGAVLTQNTNWGNVEKAIANFGKAPTAKRVAELSLPELTEIIRPAGFFNQKAVYLKAVTEWFAAYGYRSDRVKREPLEKIRPELLAVKGIGPETADSILLYAFGFPTFVIDAYTLRLAARYPLKTGKTYNAAKSFFEESLPKDTALYNNFHALIVENAKTHCRKIPACQGCPLQNDCRRDGVAITV